MSPSGREREDAAAVLATKLGLFAPLSINEQEMLRRVTSGRLRVLQAREDIIREGEAPGYVNLIVSGWACRYKLLEDGRRQILSFLFPGDLCDLRIFILKRMDHSIGTLMPTTIAEIPRDAIIELTEGGSPLARALWWSSLVSDAIEREWIVNLGQRTALERLSHLFCEMYVRQNAVGLTSGMSCDMPLTQAELAEACGLSTVHINRSLQDLRGQGLVELQRKCLTIHDFNRLARLALFTPNYLHLDHVGTDEPASNGSTAGLGVIGKAPASREADDRP